MKYKLLGKNKLSVLGLGTSNFGERTSEKEAEKIILKAVDNGINFIDTANVYPNQGLQGKSEIIIGNVLKKHNLRNKVFLATKVRGRMSDKPGNSGLSKSHILKQIDDSLNRLKTNKADLYQFHRPDKNIPIQEQLFAIDTLVKNKKIDYLGLSSFEPWEIMEMLWESNKNSYPRPVSIQVKYNILDRSIESNTSSVCSKYNIAIFAYSPLEGGLLTGKYNAKEKPKNARHTIWKMDFQNPKNKVKLEKVEKLLKIAKEKDVSIIQLSIAWLLQSKHLTSCIIGPRTLEQFDEYLSSLKVKLSEKDIEKIDAICPGPEVWTPSANSMFR